MKFQRRSWRQRYSQLTIEVSAEELEKAIESAYRKNKNRISVPGFRKGKVPRQMIEKMYGKEIFYEDAANALIPGAYDKAMEECEESIVSSPKIEVVQIEAGKPFIFTAEVALKPEVKLGKYKGVKVDKEVITVTEEEVAAEIEKERENNARTIEVEGRAVEDGDIATIDFEGFVDGVAFEGGKGENYPLTIGSGSFIPGFEEQLIGKNKDEEVDVNVTFPEDYHAEELKGKEALFKVTVKEVKTKELPEVDAAEVSEFETLAEYKEDIRKKLTEKKEKEARNAKEEAVITAIIEDSAMEIPDAMLETQQRQIVDEFTQRLQMQGISLEQYFQFTGLDAEKMLEQAKPQADRRIKSRLVLEAIVAAEKITVSDEDYEKEIERMAEVYNMEKDKVREMLGENETAKKQFMDDLAITKAADFVVSQAKETKKRASKKAEKAE